jgi:2,3-bisphosphoglycerate-independent phosphoglycerate mutase
MPPPLQPHAKMPGVPGPVVVAVMDGVGIGCGDEADAVARAKTPHLDAFEEQSFTTRLRAHGQAVGMPTDKDMGNSEVGHNALGAGRIYSQGATLVDQSIKSGELFKNSCWRLLHRHLQQSGGALHFLGLLSDGNVHSHIEHLKALVAKSYTLGVPKVFLHILLDGRDVPRTSALSYIDDIEACIAPFNAQREFTYRIASGGGRMVTTMDRYGSDWQIVERGWQAHVHGEAPAFGCARSAIEHFRAAQPGLDDQHIPPFVIHEQGEPVGPMRNGDAVVAFNFRGDRMLQVTSAFENDEFEAFNRGLRPNLFYCGMTLYDGDLSSPRQFLVEPPHIVGTLGERLCDIGVGQLACSETQKYGHVTYFWNGNRSDYFDSNLEHYIEIPSHPPPFEVRPAMRAQEITEATLAALSTGSYRFARINYPNGDMLGHTGNLSATIAGMEALDRQLGVLADAIMRAEGALILTADHGNAEDMGERCAQGRLLRDHQGGIIAKTSHSLNPVPCFIITPQKFSQHYRLSSVSAPGLGHIASTALTLMGFQAPEDFLPSLIEPSISITNY